MNTVMTTNKMNKKLFKLQEQIDSNNIVINTLNDYDTYLSEFEKYDSRIINGEMYAEFNDVVEHPVHNTVIADYDEEYYPEGYTERTAAIHNIPIYMEAYAKQLHWMIYLYQKDVVTNKDLRKDHSCYKWKYVEGIIKRKVDNGGDFVKCYRLLYEYLEELFRNNKIN